MQLVGRGAATARTINISASGLVRGDHRVFTAVGGVRIRKAHTVTTIAATMQPVSWYSQGCDTFESRALFCGVPRRDKQCVVCEGTDSVTLETSG